MELTELAAGTAAFLFNVSLRSLLIFSAAGMVLLFLRRVSAAGRHLLWAMTVGSLLLLPVLCAWLPRWNAPVLPSPTTASLKTAANVQSLPDTPLKNPRLALPNYSVDNTGSATLVRPSVSSPVPSASAAEWLIGLWLSGVLIVLGRTAFSLLAARRLLRGSYPVTENTLVKAAVEAGHRLSLSTPLTLKMGTAAMPVAVPMTFGMVHPVVLVPMEAVSWPAERLRVVLLHEAAHVKRMDWMTTMLAQVVCALYWFHPLVWLAAHCLRVDSEQACDDFVLESGVEAVEYADHLMEVVRRLAGRRVSSAVVTMAYRQEVAERLKTILAVSQNRAATTGREAALATLAALALVLPLAAMHPTVLTPLNVQQQQAKPVEENAPWRVSLPDGTQARLLSVAAGDPAMGQKPSSRTFVASFSFPSTQVRREAHHSLYVPDDLGRACGYVPPFGDREVQIGTNYNFPPDQKQTDLVLTIAEGPYRTLVVGTFQAGGSQKLPTGESVTLSRAAPTFAPVGKEQVHVTQVMLTVPLRFVSDPYEYGLDVLGRDGQPLRVVHTSSNIPSSVQKTAHIFCNYRTSELPPGGVSGFRFRCRLVHTFVLKNVPLRPGTISN